MLVNEQDEDEQENHTIACSLGVGLRTPNLEEGKAVGGRGWYCSKERL